MLWFFLENGADADVIDAHCMAGDPINTTLRDNLLSHGAKINHQDKDGNTALHLMARNLRQVQAAKFLISRARMCLSLMVMAIRLYTSV